MKDAVLTIGLVVGAIWFAMCAVAAATSISVGNNQDADFYLNQIWASGFAMFFLFILKK